MEVLAWQHHALPGLDPALGFFAQAFGTMAIGTGMIRVALLLTGIAAIHVASEELRTTMDDVSYHAAMRGRHEPRALSIDESMEGKDVGNFDHRSDMIRFNGSRTVALAFSVRWV